MIFATIGNDHRQFHRFTGLISHILHNTNSRVFYQHGYTAVDIIHPRLILVDFITREKFVNLLVDSSIVLSHAGAGTLLQCAYHNKIPFVIPRRVALREHINDHQVETLYEFVQLNLAKEVKYPLTDLVLSEFFKALTQAGAINDHSLPNYSKSKSNLLVSLQATINSILDS